jgi:hypothetical protein
MQLPYRTNVRRSTKAGQRTFVRREEAWAAKGKRVLEAVTAVRFDGRVRSGKAKPCRLACQTVSGDEVEVVAKLSAGCERGVAALVSEAVTAVLAADLGLPVPEPSLVTVEA